MEPSTVALTAGAWAWSKYGKTLTDRTGAEIKNQWNRFKWNAAANAYREKVKKLYGAMQIMGMATPVPLDDIFTEAYVLDKPTAFGRFDIERLKEFSGDPDTAPMNAKRIAGLTLVKKNRNLFILGKPGAGKTTFLKYMALKAAEQLIDKVPIFVSLKQWSDSGVDLMPFILERFDICDFPAAESFIRELLKSGDAILLFDGLDEVNQEGGQRDKQTRAINDFVEKYDRTQCLITCRVAASDYSFRPFTYVELADFTTKQIKTFVDNWFRNQEGEKDEETRDRFLSEFAKEDNKGLRDLARTPLLLTLLCLSFNETLTFPQRRVEIYQEALDALLKKWDSSRRIKRDEIYRKLSLGHKENMLARIAAETFEKDEYFMPQGDLERLIVDYVKNVPPHDTNEIADGEPILKAMEAQHGIFVERAHKVYSFSHLTFQEYFTAKYIAANSTKRSLTNLVKFHCADARWREVFLLTTSLLPSASEFMNIFRRRVDNLLENDAKLKAVLTWSNKSSLAKTDWQVRRSRLFVGIVYESQSEELTSALDQAMDEDRDLDCALGKVVGRPAPSAEDRRRSVEIEIDVGLELALFYARLINSIPDISMISRGIRSALAGANKLKLADLARDLSKLEQPSAKSDLEHSQRFADELRAVMIKHRDIGHAWNLTPTQEERLTKFFNGTALLADCLALAFMPPEEKRAILDSLYLPPNE